MGHYPSEAQKTIQATMQRRMRTMLHPSLSRWLIEIFVIITWHILYSQTWYLPVQSSEGATEVHKYMPQTLDELELSQWHPEMKHTRPCCCCLLEMESHQLVYVTMPRRWLKVSFIRSSNILHIIWNKWSNIPNAAEREIKKLKKGVGHELLTPEHQSAYGTTA